MSLFLCISVDFCGFLRISNDFCVFDKNLQTQTKHTTVVRLMYARMVADNGYQMETKGEEEGKEEQGEGTIEEMIGVTWYRWVILFIFSLQNLVNSIMWICFGMSFLIPSLLILNFL